MSSATDRESINPYDPPAEFSRHYEPPEVGGEGYWRCEECGAESISWKRREMYSEFVHEDGCSVPREP